MKDLFNLSEKIIIITGGTGFLGKKYAEAIAAYGGIPVLLDLSQKNIDSFVEELNEKFNIKSTGYETDITNEKKVAQTCQSIIKKFGKIDALINNAANNPKVTSEGTIKNSSRLENFPLEIWNKDISVGLTGAFLCSKYFGYEMAKRTSGNIINISSDLGLIAPNQTLYKQDGISEEQQNVKPVTYSVTKTGILGLTRYLATYWANKNIRCNALCFGGVHNNQNNNFLDKVNKLIPMGRMAQADEYQGPIIFLLSESSSYINGSVISVDGGRTCW
jgi:NAD(P)-dependent dehydrogenase (short-subunit alcohol dehydrogenase family)